MSNEVHDVTELYRRATIAAERFDPGRQPDIAELMRAAFRHGYAEALRDSARSQGKEASP